MRTPLHVVVIGAGNYVCGRGGAGLGTVLPTLAQAQCEGLVGEIHLAATSEESVAALLDKKRELDRVLGFEAGLRVYPRQGRNPNAYLEALSKVSRPAAALVVVPDHLHCSVGLKVIEAGLHILMVKPLAPTLQEALVLRDAAAAKGLYAAVEFHKRFDEANLIMRQQYEDGRLGSLAYAMVEYSQRRQVRGYFSAWLDKVNIFQYLGVHYLDLIHFVTKARPIRAMATCQDLGRADGALDAIQALIQWRPESGPDFVSAIMTNWCDPDATSAMSDQKITLVGSKGRYQSDQKHRGVQIVDQAGVEDLNPYFSQIYRGRDGVMRVNGYGPACIRAFLGDALAVAGEACSPADLEATRPTFTQALVSSAVVEAVNRSLAAQGEWVPVARTS